MVCDSYIIYVCPDPDCEYWDVEDKECPGPDDSHKGWLKNPELVELTVNPVKAKNDALRYLKGSIESIRLESHYSPGISKNVLRRVARNLEQHVLSAVS